MEWTDLAKGATGLLVGIFAAYAALRRSNSEDKRTGDAAAFAHLERVVERAQKERDELQERFEDEKRETMRRFDERDVEHRKCLDRAARSEERAEGYVRDVVELQERLAQAMKRIEQLESMPRKRGQA